METIKNALGLGSTSQEPVSGRTGNTSAGEPYDAGNISSTDTQRVGGSDLGSSHVGAVSQSQGAMGATGDATRTAPGGDNSSSHVGAISSSSGRETASGTGDATRTAPGGDNSSSHVGAISSSSGSGLAQPSERDAARAAGTDRMTSGATSEQKSHAGMSHTGTSHTGASMSHTTGSSNIGPVSDGRGTSGSSMGLGSSIGHSNTGDIGPISDGRNTSDIRSGVTGDNYSSGNSHSSSAIPGTSGAAVGASSGFLPIRSGDSPSVLGDEHGMNRSSQATTGIQTAQREGEYQSSGSSLGSSTHHTGMMTEQSSGRTGQSQDDTSYGNSRNLSSGEPGVPADAPPRAGSQTGNKDNLEESKKHASPAVAQILEEADQKVKEKGIRKLGPNESDDPQAAKEFEHAAADDAHHKKPGMADKVKGALHMGGHH